jgi:hypothetical protein
VTLGKSKETVVNIPAVKPAWTNFNHMKYFQLESIKLLMSVKAHGLVSLENYLSCRLFQVGTVLVPENTLVVAFC